MIRIQKLESLSRLIGIKLPRLILIGNQSENLYFEKTQLKKDGTQRIINPPREKLKIIQRRILDRILIGIQISSHAFGWIKGKSRIDCLKGHTNKKIVYTADISDFFPSIHYARIYKLFNKKFNYSPDVSRLVTQLTTYNFGLPQGSPSSPMLTNIILKPFDDELFSYWEKQDAYYSRFGDDIIVSSNSKLSWFKKYLTNKVKKFGLKINVKKFQEMRKTKRQKILGLIINEKVNMPKKEIEEVKRILHKAKNSGLETQNKNNHPNFRAHIAGRIVQIKIFNPDVGEKLWEKFRSLN